MSLERAHLLEQVEREAARACDLEAARQVQQSLFPQELPRLSGWDFAAGCRPARQVAGDYYDLFEVAPGQVALAHGDVAGKGLGPALVTAGLHALIRSRLPQRAADLPCLAHELNDYLLASTPPEMFVTLFLGILDVRSGHLRYVNAGHPAPLHLPNREAKPVRLAVGGPILGILPEIGFEEGNGRLEPGSLLALFSDGITDAAGRDGERFRERRILDGLRRAWSRPVEHGLARLFGAVEAFTGRPEPTDDLSLVLVRRQA